VADDRFRSPTWHDVVRRHFNGTLGLVVAQTGDCLKIQRDELDLVPGRRFRPVQPADLPAIELGDSWFIGVLLCPGDTTSALAAWGAAMPRTALWRIRFYVAKGTDSAAALEGWIHAGLPEAPRFPIAGFRAFHKLFGRHHADVVYRDATRSGRDAA
jgi:hypothetical protein